MAGLLCQVSLSAQKKEVLQKVEVIKGMTDFIYGEGEGATPADADRNALQSLLGKIGTTVNSSFNILEHEINNNGKLELKSDVSMIMNSYSQVTVNNTQTLNWRDKNGRYYQLKYMLRSELDKIFAHRQDRVEDYVRESLRAEQKGRVDNALRFLNWAYVLLHSLQYPGGVKMKIDGDDRLLINWIPSRMTEILKDVEVSVAKKGDDNTVDVLFKYKDKPAAGIDFTYWNGKTTSSINSAKGGLGQLSFPEDMTVEDVMLVIETSYKEASRSDKELEMIIGDFKPQEFPEARKIIGVEGKALKPDREAKKEFNSLASIGKREKMTKLDKKDAKEYQAVIDKVLKSVIDKSYKPDPSYFTEDGLDMFDKLLGYGQAYVLGSPEVGFYPFGERVVARCIPMRFDFKNNKRTFIEDVTFTFSPEKKIESVAFGLGESARKDIFEQGVGAWSDSVKMVIVTFLENYKTAFALKRLDYINSIFDENAYIIVGHKLEQVKKMPGDGFGISIVPKYEYARKSKSDYIDQLKRCFESNEYVNINFSDNDVQKAAYGGDTFGIQIRQDYYSEHYGDQGYLFLFVDLNDADKPVIKIRTWQPERNPDLTPMLPKSNRDFGIYSNSMFQ
ncbi:MAG: hypothetical protein K2N09_01945 [Muribaculaceae bacterium]|nr:hypothetical protein [Muribaculaceae bacterium]